ncbi:MAG TPA: hypothetical protein VKA91_04445 [Nitrososphaeraceae archaeon]|nr:hypothetical protein [Nitrososphaeraceae archaeon]
MGSVVYGRDDTVRETTFYSRKKPYTFGSMVSIGKNITFDIVNHL